MGRTPAKVTSESNGFRFTLIDPVTVLDESAEVGKRSGTTCSSGADSATWPMLTFSPIGVSTRRLPTRRPIPKGCGATHEAEGSLDILPEFERGLDDIEGFSRTSTSSGSSIARRDRASWRIRRADDRPPRRLRHAFAAAAEPIGLTVVQLLRPRWTHPARARRGHARRHAGFSTSSRICRTCRTRR
jgi:hypothetical protein